MIDPRSTTPRTRRPAVNLRETKTYYFDITTGRLSNHRIDGIEALKQAIHLRLATPKRQYLIYGRTYGADLWSNIGGPSPEVAQANIKKSLQEDLMRDERITGVRDITIDTSGSQLHASFTVDSVYGEVMINV